MTKRAAFVLLITAMAWTASAQDLPGWPGVWIAEGLTADINGFPPPGARRYKLYGDQAPWNEIGQARFEAMLKNQGTRKANGWGFPMMMDSAAPMQFLITPHETLIINMYRDVRHVYTDRRALPPKEDRWSTTWGASVGRWEGDTLIIETVSVRDPTRFFFSSPGRGALRRAHPSDGTGRIEAVMTIEDPVTLSEPWVVELSYLRAAGSDRLIHDDYTNDRSEVDGDTFTITPSGRQ